MMTLDEAREHIGGELAYRPDPNSPPRERGTVTSVGSVFVFVRYGAGTTSAPTRPEDLELVPDEWEASADAARCAPGGNTHDTPNAVDLAHEAIIRDHGALSTDDEAPTREAERDVRVAIVKSLTQGESVRFDFPERLRANGFAIVPITAGAS